MDENKERTMDNKKTIIQTDKLCKSFSVGGVQHHIIKNMDLSIYDGDFTVIMGSSGAGKSTLLYALSGMDKANLGKIGSNINQIAKYFNQGGYRSMNMIDSIHQCMDEMHKAFIKLSELAGDKNGYN